MESVSFASKSKNLRSGENDFALIIQDRVDCNIIIARPVFINRVVINLRSMYDRVTSVGILSQSRLLIFSLLAMILVACGGGGGGGASTDSTTTSNSGQKAEGVYEGTLTTGETVNILALENDEVYVLYGQNSGGSLRVYGFDWAQGTSKNGTYSASVVKDYYYTGAVTTGSVVASYIANTSFNGTATINGVRVGFTSAPPTNSLYIYNTPAMLSAVAGSWTGTLLSGEAGIVTISTSGALTANFKGSYSGTCTATGSVLPRNSGKNVYDLSLTFGSAPCLLPGTTVGGVMLSYLLTNGQKQMIAVATTTNKSSGNVFFARR